MLDQLLVPLAPKSKYGHIVKRPAGVPLEWPGDVRIGLARCRLLMIDEQQTRRRFAGPKTDPRNDLRPRLIESRLLAIGSHYKIECRFELSTRRSLVQKPERWQVDPQQSECRMRWI